MKVIAVIIVKDEMKLIFKRWQKKKKNENKSMRKFETLFYFSSSFLLQHFYYSTHLSWWRNLMTYIVNTLFPISFIHRFGINRRRIRSSSNSPFVQYLRNSFLWHVWQTASIHRRWEGKSSWKVLTFKKIWETLFYTKQK